MGEIGLVVIDVAAIVAIVAIGETRVIIIAVAALSQLSGQLTHLPSTALLRALRSFVGARLCQSSWLLPKTWRR